MADQSDARFNQFDIQAMQRALQLARAGEGLVEPNPQVGCVLARDGQTIGEGYHARFGGPHAEVEALRDAHARDQDAAGATAYVTLEPCSHVGKTGPCADALVQAGVSRVVIGHLDPFPEVQGRGVSRLQAAGIEVQVGLLANECLQLTAPFRKRIRTGHPWVIAKWAMTLDGKIATHQGDSRWISSSASRQCVQALRGRVDGILVGIGTVLADDPMLNARPLQADLVKRTALRIVLDRQLRIPHDSRLLTSADELPTVVAAAADCNPDRLRAVQATGARVWQPQGTAGRDELDELLTWLADQGQTNLLVEGGGLVFGSFHDQDLFDELHVWVGPKLFGGAAPGPVAGTGVAVLAAAGNWQQQKLETID